MSGFCCWQLFFVKASMKYLVPLLSLSASLACSGEAGMTVLQSFPAVDAAFQGRIDLNNPLNYANQPVPGYIRKFNDTNFITNSGATLGRVLFYDKRLSSNETIACASCHQQQHAFSDTAVASQGVNGTTGRHSMRLINARFALETRFFWNERAQSLEAQTTIPVRDHGEMGFSGVNGDPEFSALLTKLSAVDFYRELFRNAFGSEDITEARIQLALGQFIRSIQSFDSKFDAGCALVPNNNTPFANFTAEENLGKSLFLLPPVFSGSVRTGGGLGCAGCHRAPEFDIDPNSANNGVIGTIAGGTDTTNTRSPSLRDLVKADGSLNGPMMHDGSMTSLNAMLEHYNAISTSGNTNLDTRLRPNGSGQSLNMTAAEKNALAAFLKTLTGSAVYTDQRWSNPFNK
ncbi:MAG: cytochrome c peroxidase [Turneriella sp.]